MAGSQSPTNAADRPRLTEAQKKENHIRSEQKRREAIREGFDRLASIVPGMEGQGRSEAVVLDATVKYLRGHRYLWLGTIRSHGASLRYTTEARQGGGTATEWHASQGLAVLAKTIL
jgi:hypothetical protein